MFELNIDLPIELLSSPPFLEAENSFLKRDCVSPGLSIVESKTFAIEDYLV
jgi:hypothetical protein